MFVKTWNSPAGTLILERYPFNGDKSHQAWDAADEWILTRFPQPDSSLQPVIITGEAFGVLGTAWAGNRITAINDSLLSIQALEENRRLNPGQNDGLLQIMPATSSRDEAAEASRIFIRLPKSLELLEIYLRLSLSFASSGTEIWLGGMDRRWNRGVKKITDRYLETAEVFPFERHARWIRFNFTGRHVPPMTRPTPWTIDKYGLKISPAPAVFSASGLDPGTAAFLEVFPESETRNAAAIADMGCGSGILGLTSAKLNPDARVVLSDESYLAVKAAEENAVLNGLSQQAEFISANGLHGLADGSVDLVLCNPPFHYQNIQTREPASFMFGEAARVLRPGGTLQIVGNSHLGYHKLLKTFFTKVREVGRSDKFTVLRTVKKT